MPTQDYKPVTRLKPSWNLVEVRWAVEAFGLEFGEWRPFHHAISRKMGRIASRIFNHEQQRTQTYQLNVMFERSAMEGCCWLCNHAGISRQTSKWHMQDDVMNFSTVRELNEQVERQSAFLHDLRSEIGKVMVGQEMLVTTHTPFLISDRLEPL